jgi:hypothetical protein
MHSGLGRMLVSEVRFQDAESPHLSFITQRHDRVHAHRAARGDKAGEERDGAEQNRHGGRSSRAHPGTKSPLSVIEAATRLLRNYWAQE